MGRQIAQTLEMVETSIEKQRWDVVLGYDCASDIFFYVIRVLCEAKIHGPERASGCVLTTSDFDIVLAALVHDALRHTNNMLQKTIFSHNLNFDQWGPC